MYLLDVMKTRSRTDAILFARKLSKTKGTQDLGKKILAKAGEEFEETSQPVEDTRQTQPYIAIPTLPTLLVTLFCIAVMLIFIIQWKACTGNSQEDRVILIYLEKQDHLQTVIISLPCAGKLTVSMFGQKETKQQQTEGNQNRKKASEYKTMKEV
ncbi:uncharacterized protein LOC134181088 [Corticium candelabrum]|uniref:uncharacterized protein LOC134181088 n=1 Tax=Corticium candelabrum TaxID=121492 RepID=UPI002E2533EC|nr:uncharacterized protein LOC134181088 [Corticium candelabrum]